LSYRTKEVRDVGFHLYERFIFTQLFLIQNLLKDKYNEDEITICQIHQIKGGGEYERF